jgi:FkbM family methyltransferase
MTLDERLTHLRLELAALSWPQWLGLKWRRWRSRGLPKTALQPFRVRWVNSTLYFRPQSSDFEALYDVLLRREFRCMDHLKDVRLVIDCGANVGYASAYLLSRHPTCHVIAVEPDEGNFALLQKNLQPYGSRVTLLKTGIWSSPAGLVFSEGKHSDWAVQVREAQPGEVPALQAVDINTILRQSGHQRIDVLKIDIEGSELDVFARHTQPWLSATNNLVIELHSDACRRVFHQAIGDQFELSTCDELTVCARR